MIAHHVARASFSLAIASTVACGADAPRTAGPQGPVTAAATATAVPAVTIERPADGQVGMNCSPLSKEMRAKVREEIEATLGAITRAASASADRGPNGPQKRSAVDALCRTATPFPPSLPRCAPAKLDAETFAEGPRGGGPAAGWSCLRFGNTDKAYARFGYVKGGPFRGPAVGGPDPGPNGFEAWAEEDYDGDGRVVLYTLTGKVDGDAVITAKAMFVSE